MLKILKWIARLGRQNLRRGLSPRLQRARAWRRFWNSYRRYSLLRAQARETHPLHLLPYVGEDEHLTAMEPIYFYQDCWAFEKIVENQPEFHIDVGSHHKFVALLSKVVPVTIIDIRPLQLALDSLKFQEGSVLAMPFADGELPSISSLCVIEHIGLGRYGDPLDVQGTEKAIAELKRVTAPGGNLYLSVPIDTVNATFFNANRLFEESYLKKLFHPFEIIESRYIYGDNFGDKWQPQMGTGCYHLRCPLD